MGQRAGNGRNSRPTNDDQPWSGLDALVQTARDIERIRRPMGAQGRYPLMLRRCRASSRRWEEVFVVACFDQYPFSLAAQLMGINEIMLKPRTSPMVEALMHRCVDYAVARRAQAMPATC